MTFKKEGCTGTIIDIAQQESNVIDICFDMECRDDGNIKLLIKPPEFRRDITWLIDVFHEPSNSTRLFLKGQTADGDNITSSNIYLTQASPQIRQGGERNILAVEVECTELRVSITDFERGLIKSTAGCIRYDIKGFRCFQAISVMAGIGNIAAAGTATIDDYDKITGAISVETNKLGRVSDWARRSSDQVELILDIFSLAGGRYLEWSRQTLSLGNEWVETVFRSTAHRGKPSYPIFHFLHMQPVLELAVNRYSKKVKDTSGLGVAIEQFLIPSLYVETQFTTSFMALEQLVNTFANAQSRSTILSDEEFADFVIPEVMAGLKRAQIAIKASRDTKEAREKSLSKSCKAIRGKINELNRYPFIQNMWKFLAEIGVPIEDLPREEIEKMVQTRHTIIHSGSIPPDSKGKQQALSLLRELLTRIFLTILKFEGEYSSYLNGHQFKQFPHGP